MGYILHFQYMLFKNVKLLEAIDIKSNTIYETPITEMGFCKMDLQMPLAYVSLEKPHYPGEECLFITYLSRHPHDKHLSPVDTDC